MREKVFESIRIFGDAPIYNVIGSADKTVGQWNRLIQRELKQDIVWHRAMGSSFVKSDIVVRWVIGDVLCIETSKPEPNNGDITLMYINAAAMDCLIQKMRENKGHEFYTFVDAIRKNYYDAYGAAVLILGFIQRHPSKKKLFDARTGWRKLLRYIDVDERRETIRKIDETIPESPEKKTLLSWHLKYSREITGRKDLEQCQTQQL